ncbi:hypothetical protein PVAND_002625 [Polypedilum vanderplanki]|uniref:Cysteine and histidine-rich domain-containing protein n=1 Tax=Polypedilum vanderplanki TaxID=319348 RepID=A0A9J6BSA5_POLVA|nr:hypothetical protein PVAND_002625 [Polypedilum vanderplanki]
MALVSCYNKGCGQKFDPNDNGDDKCQFHPGAPIFHDAYKGWSCCNKKSTDFTEFLNFKGCKIGRHSNEKPPEVEKPKTVDIEIEQPKVNDEDKKKEIIAQLPRPSFESPLKELVPTVNVAFKQQMDQMDLTNKMQATGLNGEIPIGTSCKNGGCKASYKSAASNDESCVHHPGIPIFHEGMKFWTCCQRKTSDFQTFLEQVGCETGKHKWIQEGSENKVNCRWDWHQTANNVVVAVYAKNYDYKKSFVKVNPIRLMVKIVFPQENNAEFNIDLELRGIIDVDKATAKMFGTKIEITLPKAEGGQWLKLDFPRETVKQIEEEEKEEPQVVKESTADDSDVDLDDIEIIQGAKITDLASQKFE